jgi:DNA-binding FadR family transcriptional regulator
MSNLSPGREHDLRVLEDLYNKAKTPQERNKWSNKIQTIRKEANKPAVMHLRSQIIEAYQRGDRERAEDIGEQLYKETRN